MNAEVIEDGRDAFHLGCPLFSFLDKVVREAPQGCGSVGGPGQGVQGAAFGGESRPPDVLDFTGADQDADCPSLATLSRKKGELPFEVFEVMVRHMLEQHGLQITSGATMHRLHQLGATRAMVEHALRIARRNDAVNVGYWFALVRRWAQQPDVWAAEQPHEHDHREAPVLRPGRKWSSYDDAQLRELVLEENMLISDIAEMLHRTPVAVQNRITKKVPGVRGQHWYPAFPAPIPTPR